jgi:anti-anti-sigma regulatory factor
MSPLLPSLWQKIVGARSSEPEVALRELVLNVASLGLVLAGLLWLTAEFLVGAWNGTLLADLPALAAWYAGAGLGVLACAVVYGLSRAGRILAASGLLIVTILVYAAWTLARQGIEVSDVALFFLALSLAGLLLRGRGTLATAVIALLIYVVVGILQGIGIHPKPLSMPWPARVVGLGLLLFSVALINRIGGKQLSGALREARQQAATLRATREEQALLLADLQAQTKEQARLLRAVEELAAPVIAVHDGVIVLPIVGYVDDHRADQIRQALLEGIARHRARIALIELTGLSTLDAETVRHLEAMTQAGRLLGAEVILVGISAWAAAEMIRLGSKVGDLKTQRDLQSGIEWALARMGKGVTVDG